MQEDVIELSVPNLTNEMKVREMNDKYVKLADVKRKLRYIFKAYGVGSFVREKVERALNNLPYSVKGDLETTLKASDVQPVVYAHKTINVGRRSYCSNCGKLAIMEDFCSKCGAKVKDGEQND